MGVARNKANLQAIGLVLAVNVVKHIISFERAWADALSVATITVSTT
jgi:hypothetical protein